MGDRGIKHPDLPRDIILASSSRVDLISHALIGISI